MGSPGATVGGRFTNRFEHALFGVSDVFAFGLAGDLGASPTPLSPIAAREGARSLQQVLLHDRPLSKKKRPRALSGGLKSEASTCAQAGS